MNKLEPEKLEWMRDLPAPRKRGTRKVRLAGWGRKAWRRSHSVTRDPLCTQAMQARFDFDGALIPPTEDLPTHLGLHHHGDEPEVS